ncbi:MAG: ribonuclease P protein component [Verrucomicrobia bacterium]|nr:ribonuclease P protein component [Verrucomicrobiota bacterium]
MPVTVSDARLSLRFSRSQRLRTMRDFAQVRNEGLRRAKGCLIVNWTLPPAGSLTRIGLITSRKLGKAIVRTRARRLLREAYRLHQHDLRQPANIVLIARSSIVGKKLADVERDFLSVLRQAKLLKTAL